MSEPLKGGFASFASGNSPFKTPTIGTPASGTLFGATNNAPGATGTTAGASSTPNPFTAFSAKPAATGGSIFGGGVTTNPTAPSTSTGGTGLFAGFGKTTNSNTSGNAAAPTQTAGTGLFGAKPAEAQTTNAAAPKPTSMFGNFGSNLPAVPQATPSTGSTPSSFFSAPPKPADAGATSNTPAAQPGGGLFGGGIFGKKPDAPAAPAASTTPASTTTAPSFPSMPNLFGAKKDDDANKDKDKPAEAPKPGGLFGGLGTAKPAEGATPFSLFGQKPAEKDTSASGASGEKKDATGTTTTVPSAASTTPAFAPASGLGTTVGGTASACGPPLSVPPPSMLRGKTIEEIVNKWTTDLETHYKEFNRLAGEVAVWDRALIDNGNTIAALFQHVILAEREQSDIEQSLKHVEEQQKELASTLEVYEKSASEIFEGQSGGLRALDVGPADAERDKHYTLAADLNTSLDDLSRSLTQMIESVNELTPSKDGDGELGKPKEDAPLDQIAQILGSHLESLQWIDGAVREVETKVTEVERRVREVQPAGVNAGGRSGSLGGSTNGLNGSTRSRGFGLR